MFYTRLQVVCDSSLAEMLMAEIAETGFDTFMENEKGFEAYAESNLYDKPAIEEIRERYNSISPVIFFFDRVEKKNWNEEWEKSFEPVIVDDQCIIRATFHTSPKKYPYEIIITPKMSFGTGHHQTTYLMIKNQLNIDHTNKRVMDAGCGTAVLSIMAAKRGATFVDAFDIDEWSVINGQENIDNNLCNSIRIRQGKINELSFEAPFDIILANINKNILLQEMNSYAAHLAPQGLLLLSGFYENDIVDLELAAKPFGLTKVSFDTRENWAALLMKKH